MKASSLLLIVVFTSGGLVRADVPNQITHQGRIAVAGSNFTGAGHFKYLLFADGDTNQNNGNEIGLWANNKTSTTSMSEPTASLKLPVNKGLFSVMLGDANLNNMAPLPANLDPGAGRNLYLRTWFSDGTAPFEKLEPDRRIGAAPFALLARRTLGGLAENLDANSFNISEIGSVGIGTSNPGELLHISSVGNARILLEADTNDGPSERESPQLILRQDGGDVGMTLGFSESSLGDNVFGLTRRTGGFNFPGTLAIETATGDIGIGTIAPNVRLDVVDTANPLTADPAIRATTRTTSTSSLRNALNLVHSTSGNMTNGFGSSLLFSIQDNAEVRRNIGQVGAVRAGADDTGMLSFRASAAGALRTVMTVDADGDLALFDPGGRTEFTLRADDFSLGPWLAMYGEGIVDPDVATDADRTLEIHGDESGGGSALLMRNGSGKLTVELDASEGTEDPIFRLWDNSGVDPSFAINSHDGSFGGAYLEMRRENNLKTIEIDAAEDDGDAVIRLWGSEGTGAIGDAAIILDSDINGASKITVDVLQLRGSDLSETFDISPSQPDEKLKPGMVVSIDPDHPGDLIVSQSPYDTRVAGIISGAGGVRAGIVMGQPDTIASGAHAVAMTGRVWVEATTENGAISPGDLLTTSSRPGYSMRADDPARAFGAVLGKAMTFLTEGEGRVLVLVNLQ